jgi:uncharacterized Fe-S cluster-containing protein
MTTTRKWKGKRKRRKEEYGIRNSKRHDEYDQNRLYRRIEISDEPSYYTQFSTYNKKGEKTYIDLSLIFGENTLLSLIRIL